MTEELPFHAAAVLIWLDRDIDPRLDGFDITEEASEPPHPNPEAWWLLHEAINYACTVIQDSGKLP